MTWDIMGFDGASMGAPSNAMGEPNDFRNIVGIVGIPDRLLRPHLKFCKNLYYVRFLFLVDLRIWNDETPENASGLQGSGSDGL
jgi:hypothetical protein